MRVLMVPGPSPYIEADPGEVTVTRLEHSFGGWEAWGTLASERTLDDLLMHAEPLNIIAPRESSGPERRVAYTNDAGSWQAEGTVRRESPPPEIMEQIVRLWAKMHGPLP